MIESAKDLAPIVLFVYNRPWHTQQTVEALQKNELAKDSELFIYCDAAKNDTAEQSVGEVRSYIKLIEGFKKITIVEREINWGLADSIIDGVTKIVNQYGKIIVLEDDLVTSAYFLAYMNKALILYVGKPKVMQVSGHMFDVEVDCTEDAFFLPFTTSWGWATWVNRWSLFDQSCNGYHQLQNDKNAIKKFNLGNSYPYFKMLEAQITGKIDSWAIRWNLTVFVHNGLVLFPRTSLVSNYGFDGSGIHCGNEDGIVVTMDDVEIIDFPSDINLNEKYEVKTFNYLRAHNSLKDKIISKISNILQIIKRLMN